MSTSRPSSTRSVADATARIDEAVTDGKLTADQAAERKAELGERITEFVQNGPPAHPDGPPRRSPRSAASGQST